MSVAVVKHERARIARPLKVLIPLIQQQVEKGDRAGVTYYADAGALLLEAKTLVSHGHWGAWLSKNFHLGAAQARRYMRLAELRNQNDLGKIEMPRSLSELIGDDVRQRERRAAAQPYRAVLAELDTDLYAQEKQTREDEVRLHREIALELIDIGWKALATRLHPDRGGSKDAMRRLNRVREQLKGVAETRRFV